MATLVAPLWWYMIKFIIFDSQEGHPYPPQRNLLVVLSYFSPLAVLPDERCRIEHSPTNGLEAMGVQDEGSSATFATALSINCLTRSYIAYGGPEPVARLTVRNGMRCLMDATTRGDADVPHRLVKGRSSGESSPDELPSTEERALILKPDGGQDHINVGKDRGNIATLDSITTVNTFTEIVAVSPGHYSEPLENLPKDAHLSDRVTTNSSSKNGKLPTEDGAPVENGADILLVGTMPLPLESHPTSSTEAANDTGCAAEASAANMGSAILIIPLETLITNAVRACGSSGLDRPTALNTASSNAAEAGYKESRIPTSCSSKGNACCRGECASHERSRCIESRNIPCDAHHPLTPTSLRQPLSTLSEFTSEEELVRSGSVFQDAMPTSDLGLRWPKGTKRPHPQMYEVPTTCVQLDELGDLLSRWTLDSDAAGTPCSRAKTPVDTLRRSSKQWAFRIPKECVWRQQTRVTISPSDDVSLPPSGKPSATTAPEPQKTDSPVVEHAGPSRAMQDTLTATSSYKPEAADALEKMVTSGTIPPSLRRIFAEAKRKIRESKPANKAAPKKSLKAQGRRVSTHVENDSDTEPTRVAGTSDTENEAKVPLDELPQQSSTQQIEESVSSANGILELTSPSSSDKADATVRPPLDVSAPTSNSSTDTRTINGPNANPRAPVQPGNGRPLTYIIRSGRVTRHLFTPRERQRPEEMDYTYDDDSEDELDGNEDVKMTDSDNDSGYVSNVSPVVNSPMEGASSCTDTDVDMQDADEPELQQHVDHQPIYDTAMDLDDPSSCNTRSSSAAARRSEERERWERYYRKVCTQTHLKTWEGLLEDEQRQHREAQAAESRRIRLEMEERQAQKEESARIRREKWEREHARNRTAPPFYDGSSSEGGEIKEGTNDGDSTNKKDGPNDEDADDEHESDG
ncbi:MAG: hypothetical protein Q9178_004609 [Gyalolechia marmorata]